MSLAGHWLERFRGLAAAPTVPAVPAATDEPAPELVPVFDVLDGIEQEARALQDDAEREAARRLEAASVEVEAALRRWQQRAEEERARVGAERREVLAREARAIVLDAAAEAERLRARGRERIPALVAEVTTSIRDEAG